MLMMPLETSSTLGFNGFFFYCLRGLKTVISFFAGFVGFVGFAGFVVSIRLNVPNN